jgi:hypothetical protein
MADWTKDRIRKLTNRARAEARQERMELEGRVEPPVRPARKTHPIVSKAEQRKAGDAAIRELEEKHGEQTARELMRRGRARRGLGELTLTTKTGRGGKTLRGAHESMADPAGAAARAADASTEADNAQADRSEGKEAQDERETADAV